MKSDATVGNFSLGDLLGDQIKSKLGIKDEPKKERREQAQSKEGGRPADAEAQKPTAEAPGQSSESLSGETQADATPQSGETQAGGETQSGGAMAPAAFNQPLDVDAASKAGLPLQSQDAADPARGEAAEEAESSGSSADQNMQGGGAASEDAPQPEPRDPNFAAGDQDTAN